MPWKALQDISWLHALGNVCTSRALGTATQLLHTPYALRSTVSAWEHTQECGTLYVHTHAHTHTHTHTHTHWTHSYFCTFCLEGAQNIIYPSLCGLQWKPAVAKVTEFMTDHNLDSPPLQSFTSVQMSSLFQLEKQSSLITPSPIIRDWCSTEENRLNCVDVS